MEFFSEIDKNTIKSYCAVHNIDKNLNKGDIVNIKGADLPYCDLWVAGFPCQDISCVGKMRGFDFNSATRSSLAWQTIRLLKEIKKKPKFIIYEIELDKYKQGGVCGIDKHTKFRQSSVIYSSLGYCPTLLASNTDNNCKIVVSNDNTLENIKIRKITPKEAWRMMGFSDDDYNMASKVCSETNLYHQTGNSIVVNIMYYILKQIIINSND